MCGLAPTCQNNRELVFWRAPLSLCHRPLFAVTIIRKPGKILRKPLPPMFNFPSRGGGAMETNWPNLNQNPVSTLQILTVTHP